MTHKQIIPISLIIAISVSLIASTLYLPAMTIMGKYFGVTDNVIQHSLSLFQFGQVTAAVVFGPLSDTFGRRRLMLIGYGIFLFSSIILALTHDIDYFLFMRFLQGCGSGVALGISGAIIRDLFTEREASKLLAQMLGFIILTPTAAPIVGGYLTHYFGWQSCFIVIAICVLIVYTILYVYFPETHPLHLRTRLHHRTLISNYRILFSSKGFPLYSLITALTFSAMWFYRTTMPFVFIKYMDVDIIHFGYYVLIQGLAAVLATYYVQKIIHVTDPSVMISRGIKMGILGCFTMFLAIYFAPASPLMAVLSVIPIFIGMPFIFPAASSRAMSFGLHSKGAAASTQAITNQIFGAFGSFAAAMLPSHTFEPTLIFMTIFGIGMALAFHLAQKHAPDVMR